MKKILTLILIITLLTNCQEKKTTTENLPATTNQTSKTGEFIEKYSNGTVKIKGDLVKGIRQGNWKSFYENGIQWSESNYLFGKRNGIYKLFYPNGKLKIHGSYRNDKKTGIWYFYNENGQFEKEMDFDEKPENEN